MRAIFLMGTVLLALVLGVGAALFDSRLFIAIATIGMALLIWVVALLIERLAGRNLWRFTAPYRHR
jgi:hypothetical protein